jgi:CheY-like chemotaxis protein
MSTTRTTILIVDDEPNIRLTLRAALEADGHEVLEAANGEEALDVVVRQSPRLMILDLSMPVMDGMTVLERLSNMELAQRPGVVVLTAYGSIAAAVQAMRLGARDFIEKPSTPDELREVVQHMLAEPALPDAQRSDEPGYDEVLAAVQAALREGNFQNAVSLLMKAGSITADDATFLNLVGVLHEAMGRRDVAKRYYGKAIRADRYFAPAQQNMRRLYELATLGRTMQSVALGDEIEFVTAAPHRPGNGLLQKLRDLWRHPS